MLAQVVGIRGMTLEEFRDQMCGRCTINWAQFDQEQVETMCELCPLNCLEEIGQLAVDLRKERRRGSCGGRRQITY